MLYRLKSTVVIVGQYFGCFYFFTNPVEEHQRHAPALHGFKMLEGLGLARNRNYKAGYPARKQGLGVIFFDFFGLARLANHNVITRRGRYLLDALDGRSKKR